MFGSILALASSVARAASKYHLLLRDPHFSVNAVLVSSTGDQGGTSLKRRRREERTWPVSRPTDSIRARGLRFTRQIHTLTEKQKAERGKKPMRICAGNLEDRSKRVDCTALSCRLSARVLIGFCLSAFCSSAKVWMHPKTFLNIRTDYEYQP